MWCNHCKSEVIDEICPRCGKETDSFIPTVLHWCKKCSAPVVKYVNETSTTLCPICDSETTYFAVDARPVFPEEQALIAIITGNQYHNKTLWASNSRYYDGEKFFNISNNEYSTLNTDSISLQLKAAKAKIEEYYITFNKNIELFIAANMNRLNYLKAEAASFIKDTSEDYSFDSIVISFSGGKDSTVVADLVIRALKTPSLVQIFGDTTLEFPLTYEYVKRYRKDNPKAIIKTAKNKEQDFYEVCDDIGPPARMLRWCCSMFKTGPITRTLNNMFRDKDILTFYGIRKCESLSRSKYNRIEDDAEAVKIQRQKVASPIFYWNDIDIWLYILAENIDFNNAYRLGYDRVGCWCCPNNSLRAQFLSKIYMPDRSTKWRDFLVDFAKRIGKPDAEVYVDTGKWKARQGGYGVRAANDVKIQFANCTSEENSKIYKLVKPIDDCFQELFIPFGKISKSLGRKLINEVVIQDMKSNIPIISLQPFNQEGYEYAVKIKTMNVKEHADLQRMIAYQIRKYNACRQCLKCESICKYGAISIKSGKYHIDDSKCKRCKMCVTAKYLEGGCLMRKYLFVKEDVKEITQ